MTSVFISHTKDDAHIAQTLKYLLTDLSIPDSRIFVSSDNDSITAGTSWFASLMTALQDCKVCISILTANSMYKPWIAFETGIVYFRSTTNHNSKIKAIPCSVGIDLGKLISPYSQLQARNLSEIKGVELLLNDILQSVTELSETQISSSIQNTSEQIKKFNQLVLNLPKPSVNNSLSYTTEHKKNDQELFRKINQIFPYSEFMGYIEDNDFGGIITRESYKVLYAIEEIESDPNYKFISPELEETKVKFFNAILGFLRSVARFTVPDRIPEYCRIPKELSYQNPVEYKKRVDKITAAADELVENYNQFINTKKKLLP
ncbi:MAG: toll/interleukin-1 receptor domain-containing protein [Sphingobacteriaceae bacterium]|nr:toll/interleukin-1 receptor domain-containing protein [Sphingobacteriaceae bacterium]